MIELSEFLEQPPDERSRLLSLWRDDQFRDLVERWLASPELRLTDILSLREPWRTRVIETLLSDGGRTFYVALNPAWECPCKDIPERIQQRMKTEVRLECGSKNNITKFVSIDRPSSVPPQRAIAALLQYGDLDTANQMDRGRLLEISKEEYLQYESSLPKGAEPKRRKQEG